MQHRTMAISQELCMSVGCMIDIAMSAGIDNKMIQFLYLATVILFQFLITAVANIMTYMTIHTHTVERTLIYNGDVHVYYCYNAYIGNAYIVYAYFIRLAEEASKRLSILAS